MRFKLLYEHYNRRFNSFGFQPGDLVKFKKNATSHPYVQSGSELYQNAVKALIEKRRSTSPYSFPRRSAV